MSPLRIIKRARFASVSVIALCAATPAFAQSGDGDISGDEIIVTASPLERTVDETVIGTSVVSKEELRQRLENTLAETIRREPGVSTSYFGQGASRPIIRGLGGDRIRVLDNGIGSIDAAASSPDHAVAIDPVTAEQVEIIRGSGTLLYGSSAAGGVVNVITGRIPRAAPENGVSGSLRLGTATVDDGFDVAGSFDVALGKVGNGQLVLHGDGFYRDGEDYDIPGFAESARLRALEEAEEDDHHDDDDDDDHHDEEEEVFGTQENSFYETYGANAGLSWVGDRGFFGVSFTSIDSEYGIPGGHEHEHEHEEDDHDDDGHDDDGHDDEGHDEEEEGGVIIDLRQRRVDFAGEYEFEGFLEKATFRLGYADYEHIEFEPNGEQGTVFSNEGWEGRLELVNRERNALGGKLRGAQGIQVRTREFSAIGEEAFVPPSESTQFGIFALQELQNGPWRVDIGARYEHTSHETDAGVSRDFDGISVSGGVGYQATENVFVGAHGFRTERAPSTEELFSNGPHLATNQFEIGDPDLDEEVGRGVELTARYVTDTMRVSLNGFYTSYNDFIYETLTGEEEDGLPVFQFFANDATFYGFEAEAEAELFTMGGFDVHADGNIARVKARIDVTGNDNLPRIPPLNGLFGLEARSEMIDLRAELEFATEQDDISAFEIGTDGYELFNVYVTMRPFGDTSPIAVQLAATNLTDEEARYHTSFIKDLAPVAGRNFRVSVTGNF